MADDHGAIHRIGCRISSAVAKLSADPLAQTGFLLLCFIWFMFRLNVNILTAALSILAITLTQMVLNSQGERERDAHRRDVALHAKLDELLLASRRARDELAGIEELEEEEIEELRNGGPLPSPNGARQRAILPAWLPPDAVRAIQASGSCSGMPRCWRKSGLPRLIPWLRKIA